MEEIVSLEFAKKLKAEGYWIPTEYFYQDIDLPFCDKGLKKTKNGQKLNHNKYDDFIYSAPTVKEGLDYIIGMKMYYNSNLKILLN